MPLSSGFVNELLAVSKDWRTFVMCCCSCVSSVLLVMTFSVRLNNAVMTLCFDLVE